MDARTVLVAADGRVVDPGEPLLHADDLGVVHGDGLFETLLVRSGAACGLDRHLDRLLASAAAIDLPALDRATIRTMAEIAAREWGGPGEGMLRIVCTRGREHDAAGAVTMYATVASVPDRVVSARRDGVRAVALERAPWLLSQVKSLSYAANVAALRHVRALGADDAIFVSPSGTVLEGPRSSVVAAIDGAIVTPRRDVGILPGTTQDALFELAAAEGIGVREGDLRLDDLLAADGVWLTSSVTLAARVTSLDGVDLGCGGAPNVPDLVHRAAGT